MQRRTLLAALGAGIAGLAGCQGGPGEGETPTDSSTTDPTTTSPPGTTTPSVTVEVGHGGALSPVASTSTLVEPGTVTYRVECRGDDLGPFTASEPLPDEEYEELAAFVDTLDPESWQREYRCSDTCAVDDGQYFVRLTVEGETYQTRLDTEVDPPEGISALQHRVRTLRDRIDEELPSCFGRTTTATDE